MADIVTLEFNDREKISKGEKKALLKNGYLIGNINSKGAASVTIALKKDEFKKTLKKHGRNCVLKLVSPDKKSYDVMVKDIQVNPKDYDYHHVDLQQVSLNEVVKADVTIKYNGTEFLEGRRLVLNRLMDLVTVSGLPNDIPDTVEVDVSTLNSGDNIYVGDLKFADNINVEIDSKVLVGSIIDAKLRDTSVVVSEGEGVNSSVSEAETK